MKVLLINSVILLGLFLGVTSQSRAQNKDKRTWLSFYFGHQEYDGDTANEMLKLKLKKDWAGGIGISQYLHDNWDLEISAIYGQLDYVTPERSGFDNKFYNFNSLIKLNPIGDRSTIQPFVATGIGITSFFKGEKRFPNETQTIKNSVSLQVPFQAGFDLRITDGFYATANATYNRTFSDGIDKLGSQFSTDGRDHDDFLVYSLGLKFAVSRSTDRDKDGVPNRIDLCPGQYGDSSFGCPDRDEDGITDADDDCPTIPGRKNMNGCPDSDRDGLSDLRDECPDVAGNMQTKGCPDSDGDGIPDDKDECPQQSGKVDNNGCPPTAQSDADGDGVADAQDNCPNVAGPSSNNGCPEKKELSSVVKQDLKTIIDNLQFSTGGANIAPVSYDELDRLAEIMTEDPDLRLIIRGYTDNVGDPNTNLKLSVARANAVKEYLVARGVNTNRVFAFGYGETNPVASNDTEEGRRQNRRVELELYHKQ
ncbi:OmpA family protein [Aliifodinibius sp. S!AR15-10]|uniref:OmpA family protein n=1 Tax=Aliifodinibius sp. S!AR15-10 TaxID=2950437 RepID=UPI0028611EEA|nr:OmpA family protein [Aliifodinibius sp. S!AR15-10]MDR8393547.1 OmpA family protein [Aliifodinibius sp. S!AR15-10]